MISNFSLEKKIRDMHDQKNFRGVYCKDELPKNKREGFYIVNLENAYDSKGKPTKGTHWVTLEICPNESVYVDSFGLEPPLEVIDFSKKPIHYSIKELQNVDSNLCGYYCLYFINECNKGRSWENILHDFKPFPKNEGNSSVLDKYFGIRDF